MPTDPRTVWQGLTAGMAGADAVWVEIEARHGEPHRHYHTLGHLAHMLTCLRRVEGALAPDTLRIFLFSLFFHDAVYDVQRRDNEARSAALAAERLAALGLPPDAVAAVRRWIEATAGHARTGDPALDLFLDCDLAIFAAPTDEYERYAENVCREYLDGGIDPAAFHAGRIAFLGRCLERRPFYLTRAFALFEATARDNIRDELARLAPDALV